jgi:putative membrane protein
MNRLVPMRWKIVVGLQLILLSLLPTPALAHAGGALPADLWSHWNFDWLLLVTLIVPLLLFMRGAMSYRVEWRRMASFVAAQATLFVALVSPLDALSESLFAAHMLQHLLLMLVAAPLLVWSRPLAPLLRGLLHRWRKAVGGTAHHPSVQRVWAKATGLVVVVPLHVGAVWLWHLPALYSAALNDKGIHILEHAAFFVTAALFWWVINNSSALGGRLLGIFLVMMASGLLGALMTFSSAPWYADHAPFAAVWGLTPLEDQQLAGLLMWVPAGMIYTALAAMLFGAWLQAIEQRTLKREGRLSKELDTDYRKELGNA